MLELLTLTQDCILIKVHKTRSVHNSKQINYTCGYGSSVRTKNMQATRKQDGLINLITRPKHDTILNPDVKLDDFNRGSLDLEAGYNKNQC